MMRDTIQKQTYAEDVSRTQDTIGVVITEYNITLSTCLLPK